MEALDTAFAKGFIRVCDDGFNQNWYERNGDNLSYRIKPEEVGSVKKELSYDGKWQPVSASVPTLSGEYFMVSGSGRSMHSMILKPETSCCIIRIDQTGENYRICRGLVKGGRPTSELPTHLVNHEMEIKVTEGRYRVIYHAHPVNIIALTFVLPLADEVFARELWKMATECPVVFPAGVGVVDWMVPGGHDIAVATSKLTGEYDAAVWTHRDLFCADGDFDLAFGLMHTIGKSAEVLVKVLSIRPGKLRTITPQEFRSLTVDFHMNPPEEFLYEE